jgi:hypothetical protein
MNTDTGKIYRGEVAIKAAQDRGENVVPVSERVAELMTAARRDRSTQARNKRKAASRKARGK